MVTLEQAVAAPLCTSRLARAGARVVKIERAEGDNARGYDSVLCGDSAYFAWLNQGKESVVLDIKSSEGREVLTALLARADVLVQNFAPGALDRAGFDHASLSAANPRLIRCDISGYAPDTDAAHRRGYDLLIQAESGLIAASGVAGHPGRIGVSLCDIGAGMAAYEAVLEALLQRSLTGQGSRLGISLFDVAAHWMSVPFAHAVYGDGAPQPVGLSHPSIAPYGGFPTADGETVLVSIQNEREWQRLACDVLEAPDWLDDDRYAGNEARCAHRAVLDVAIAARTARLDAAALEGRLEQASIAYGRITRVEDLYRHAGLQTQRYGLTSGESVQLPAHPVLVNGCRESDAMRRAPRLDEHGDAIRAEFGKHPRPEDGSPAPPSPPRDSTR